MTSHPPEQRAAIKQRARDQFDRWALSYDRSWLNELVFFPSIRACESTIAAWQAERGGLGYRLLDVGCGTGTPLLSFARDSAAELLVGADFTPAMVARTAEKIRRLACDRCHVVAADAERLPFADATFDVITCCNSFHHYPHQPVAAREFRRVLRPGGMLILIDGFRDNVIGWLIFDVGVYFVERDVHHASWRRTRELLLEAGFDSVSQRKMNVLAPLLVNVGRVEG